MGVSVQRVYIGCAGYREFVTVGGDGAARHRQGANGHSSERCAIVCTVEHVVCGALRQDNHVLPRGGNGGAVDVRGDSCKGWDGVRGERGIRVDGCELTCACDGVQAVS